MTNKIILIDSFIIQDEDGRELFIKYFNQNGILRKTTKKIWRHLFNGNILTTINTSFDLDGKVTERRVDVSRGDYNCFISIDRWDGGLHCWEDKRNLSKKQKIFNGL